MDHEQRGHRLAARHPTEGHDVYRDLRPLLLSIAYRMVGSYSEAEDLVQEAFVRFHEATRRGVEVESAKAFLTTVTTRLAIDHLRSARVRRESYVGPWLPDPLVDEMAPDVARTAELAESLSTAFLVLLETLSPLERAVFLLRDVFAYDYGTIAGVVDKSEDNCRQIAARARRRVAVAEPRFDPSLDERDRLAERFFAASQRGDLTALVQMLARDAVFVGDGGTKGNGLARPVEGREQVGRLLVGFARRATAAEIRFQPIHVGGQPAALLVDADDGVVAVWSLHIVNGVVQEIHGVVNPDKLAHLGPVSPFAYRRQPRDPPGALSNRRDTKMTTVERQETPTRSGAAPAIDRYVAGVTLLAAAFMLVAGVWALFWPDSFAEAVRFPEHTHFLHDVGAFQIGIGVTLALAVLWRDPPAVVLTGFVVGNTIHAANHAVDLDLGGRDSDPWLLGLVSVLVALALVRRLRQLHYVVGRVEPSCDPRLAPFVEQKTALLTTFRRDGTPVPTPLSVAVEGDHVYFRTYEKAGKTKRLRNDSHVELTPSTTRGTPTGTPLPAEARRLLAADDHHAAWLLRRKHPLLHGILVPLAHRLGRGKTGHTVHFEVAPSSST